ncbi:hypothetical protein EV702DRAFT_1048994 [Suillus placidus]|uniref:Uncharacterized protein n=1 Tax=Suillus placidus TaxID=48579 RepID=A0A9P6ZNG6_9AGAM|nr:hypothetical protein EV702DRAFT_1048994 [Suillus placidus]
MCKLELNVSYLLSTSHVAVRTYIFSPKMSSLILMLQDMDDNDQSSLSSLTDSLDSTPKDNAPKTRHSGVQAVGKPAGFTGVSLKELQACTKNGVKDKKQAHEVMDGMETWESDGASRIFQDELGNTLIAYFARRADINVETHRSSKGHTCYIPGPHTPSAMGQSSECLDNTQSTGRTVYFDGIKKTTLNKLLVSTQLLAHYISIQHALRNGRHDWGDTLMKYAKASAPPGANFTETNGRKSFVWEGVMFCVAFPEFYEKYWKAFEAGKWTVVNPGPFLGRAIVWKLSVLPHQDGLDEGPAVIFPMGRFEGGECYLPDLKLKLCALYHGIGEWTPEPGVSEDGVTPGQTNQPTGLLRRRGAL